MSPRTPHRSERQRKLKIYREYGLLPATGLTPVVGFLTADSINSVLGFIAIFLLLIIGSFATWVFE